MHPIRALLLLASFGVSLLASSAAMRCLVPPPRSHHLAGKLAWLAEHPDDYDLVFVGSSRVNYALDPEVVDARLAELGRPLRSFNLGVDGLQAFEADRIVEDVLAIGSPRLRWIVIEWPDWSPLGQDGRAELSHRAVYWHGARRTLAVLESVFALEAPLAEKLDLARGHLGLFVAHCLNYGQGLRVVRALFAPEPRDETLEQVLARQGVADVSASGDDEPERERARRRELELLEAKMPLLDALNELPVDGADYNERALRRQLALFEGTGVEPVHVVLPGKDPTPQAWRLAREGVLPDLLIFNSPARHPTLYDIDHRFDADHLNRAGARELSRLFAEAFVERTRDP